MAEGRVKEAETINAGDKLQASMDAVQNKDDVNQLASQTLRDLNSMDGKSFRDMIGQAMVKEGIGGYNNKGMDIAEIKLDKDGSIKELSFVDPFSKPGERTTLVKGGDKPKESKISDACRFATSPAGDGWLFNDPRGGNPLVEITKTALMQLPACADLKKGMDGHNIVYNTESHKGWK